MSSQYGWAVSSVPRYWPHETDGETAERPVRRWRVLHACDEAGSTADVARAQVGAGMQPSLLTLRGWYLPLAAEPDCPSSPLSLIHEWQQVRQWRLRFLEEQVDKWVEVLHAHSFSAAMAGLRSAAPVVYDLADSIGAGVVPRPGPWLLRSLRAAEQFALVRAAAVVVHSQSMSSEALRRGVALDNLFLVPDPVETPDCAAVTRIRRSGEFTLFAPDGENNYECLIQAFAAVTTEIDNAKLLLTVATAEDHAAREQAAKAGVSASVEVIGIEEHASAIARADLVIAAGSRDDGPGAAVISGLAHGRAVLAADVPQNREVTPQGRGCLWYRDGDARDLAGRAAFLARNPDFRAALGASGRAHLLATRSPKVIARRYDQVYRHAYLRRQSGGFDSLRHLQAVRACF